MSWGPASGPERWFTGVAKLERRPKTCMSLSQREPRVRTESPESVVKLKAIIGLEIEAESRRFDAKGMPWWRQNQ